MIAVTSGEVFTRFHVLTMLVGSANPQPFLISLDLGLLVAEVHVNNYGVCSRRNKLVGLHRKFVMLCGLYQDKDNVFKSLF